MGTDFNTIEEALEYLKEITSEEIPSGMLIEAPTPSTSYVPAPTTYVAPTSYVPAPTRYVEPARAISAPTSYVPAPTSYVRDVAPTTYVVPTTYARDIPIPSTRYVSAPTTYVEARSYTLDNTRWQQRYPVISP